MIEKILEFADEHNMLPDSGLVLVCVSGGADSMCLLEAMRHISYQRGFEIAAAHFNHMLRGDESDRDETFVLDVCETHGIPFYSTGNDMAAYAKRHGIGIEEASRDARYTFFAETAEAIGAERIATAHTMNDNAETVIMNLTRGAGSNGMAGIPPVRGNIIRPLLQTKRDEILSFMRERRLPFVEDSTNSQDIYTRNKVRHKIIPILEELNPRFVESIFSMSEMFRADEEFIADIANLFINDCCAGLTADAKDLAVLPFSVSSRVIRKFYGKTTLSRAHVKDVLALCESANPSGSLSLPGMTVYREYDRIVFDGQPEADIDGFAPIYPIPGGNYIILVLGLIVTCSAFICSQEDIKLVESTSAAATNAEKTASNGVSNNIHKPFTTFLFKSDELCGKITVRPRGEGDAIKLKGQSGTKTLKKLFIEKRIPVRKRSQVPVICDDAGVLGIYGIGVSERAAPAPGFDVTMIVFEEKKKGENPF